jgi:hypothetical protein
MSDVPESETVNVWPDEAAETAFLSESRVEHGSGQVAIPPAAQEEELPSKALPALDVLVQRIPAETRELLDELFRAKFTTVKRVKPSDLKISET